MVPARRVEGRPFEVGQARNLGQLRTVQLAHGADHDIGGVAAQGSTGIARLDPPQQGGRVPDRACHLLIVVNAVDDPVGGRGAPDVVEDLVALGEEMIPVVVLLEGVGIEVVCRVDATPGVGVFVPGAADAVVFLDDGEGDPGFLELDPHGDARKAAADHDHAELVERLR